MNDVRKVGVVEGLLRSSSSSSNRSTLIWIPSERLVRSYNAKLNLTLFSFANPMTDTKTKTKTREAPKINIARGTTDPEIDSETCTKLGNNMAPLALIANLATGWRHLTFSH